MKAKQKSKLTKSVLNGKTLKLADNMAIESNNFNVDSNGNVNCNSANMKNATIDGGKIILNSKEYTAMKINGSSGCMSFDNNALHMYDQSGAGGGINLQFTEQPLIIVDNQSGEYTGTTTIVGNHINTGTLTQTSLVEYKKNFEKLQDNALETIKNIDIYKYNLKSEKDTDKKHIGFVIGDNYNYSKEVTSIDNQGVDNYSFTSLCCKAIQELSQQVEELKKQLKEGKNG